MRGWLRKGQGIRQRLLRIWHCVKIYQRNFERDLNSISYGLTFVSLFELEILLAIELHSPWKINFQLGNLFCLYFIFVDITKPRERRESWAISEIAKDALLSEKAMSTHIISDGNSLNSSSIIVFSSTITPLLSAHFPKVEQLDGNYIADTLNGKTRVIRGYHTKWMV